MDRSLSVEWGRSSWLESANEPGCGFPLQSLPYCVFAAEDGEARVGIGVGSFVLDLRRCSREGVFDRLPAALREACESRTLNALIACGAHAALRARLLELLDADAKQATRDAIGAALVPMAKAAFLKPIEPANYTDFYASIDHATRVGRLFRPDTPLLPNYRFVPIGYHGRASSLVVSGTPVRRPYGQTKASTDGIPVFGATRFLDYEVEVGVYIAEGNALGERISIDRAGECAFGVSLVNDWSARDIQQWEYQPLGPFLGKSFATSVSPWVVPVAALAPFRCAARIRTEEEPAPLDYLWSAEDQQSGALDLTVEAALLTPAMRDAGLAAHRLSQANLRELYWTPAQWIAHHSSNGCNLLPGDLLASGTVSGRAEDTAGCLLELTAGGAKRVVLPNKETRTALEDGDEVILRGFCRREGYPLISLGECRGTVLPAIATGPSFIK